MNPAGHGASQGGIQPSRVLIVYKVNGPDNNNNGVSDSLELAQYYALERNVPQTNLLGLTISAASYYYGTGQYGTFYADMVAPIQSALQSIGSNNIDVILLAGELPTIVYDASNTALSVDNALMGLFSLPSPASNIAISKGVNPYFDPAPGFDASPGHFNHGTYNYNGTPMYLVARLGSDSSLRGIAQVDQSLYGDRYVYPQTGYYYGNAYVDSLFGAPGSGSPYTDAFLSSQTAVQEGLYDTSSDADMNIAYAEHYVVAAGFPLKWENTTTSLSIGDPGATFSDGTSALSAPRALFYGGWYNYDKYNNVFEWLAGSVACDLNSASYFGQQALDHGASAAVYVVGEPYLNGHPRPEILYYYLLNGYSFAEASALATPFIGWMSINEGDPLYAPMGSKSPVIDTQAPALSSGSPKLAVNSAARNAVMSIMVQNTPEPDVVTAQVQYGPDTNYGAAASSGPVFARSLSITLPWASGTVYHYRIILTDPAGNVTTTGDFTTTPSVSITAPANGAAIAGSVVVSANAVDNSGVAGVQFMLDGAKLGQLATGSGPSYSISWDTTTASNGSHTLTAVAQDSFGNSATAGSVSVTVNNGVASPAISAVAASAITSSGATISWTTDQASDSQVAYGTTSAYGATSALNSGLATSHSVSLGGLAASTTYHYQALSRNAQGMLGASADFTFTTAAAVLGPAPLLQIHADASEVSGVTNGSTVTPSTAPPGFTGTVVVNGGGTVNFAPAESGNGVYFLSCCTNANNAYYRFTGAKVGNIINANQGQITFYLKSRYSFAQRQANASAPRYAFDIEDGNGHFFYFFTQTGSGYLIFNYMADGTPQYYFVPQGTEDALFGNGVILKVALVWDGSAVNLYLNDALAKSTPYTPLAPNWTAASNFDLGAYDYFGSGYTVSDDIIDEFSVTGPATTPDTTPPTVSMTAPANGAKLTDTVTVSANATDNVAVAAVQFQLDGTNLGGAVTGPGPVYSISWDTSSAANGSHVLTAIASDAAGNKTTSGSISVTVHNVAPAISAVAASAITSSGATISWTTDQASDSQVAYGTTSAYGATSALNSGLATSHSVSLGGLAASTTYHYQALSRNAQGMLGASADFTFTTAAAVLGPAPLLQIHADASEVSGVTNGSTVTPSTAPPGFTGTVVVNGGGTVNFAPAESGNGVYFLSCCTNANNAYYRFTGAKVGNIINANQGQITFYLKSRYSFAQRQANASAPRYAFDIEDGNGHFFYFFTQTGSGYLIFNYMADGTPQYYFVPQGTEDALFGNGVILKVALVWDGSAVNLYLNDALAKSTPYTPLAPNWTAASNFDLGAYDYFGSGYTVSDDIIDEFVVH